MLHPCVPAAAPISLYHSEPCFLTIFSENPTFGKIFEEKIEFLFEVQSSIFSVSFIPF